MVMTQEDKELVFKDICARLPYGVHILVHDTFEYSTVPFQNAYLKACDTSELIDSISLNLRYNSKDKLFNKIIKERKNYLEIKPYLLPMSSMTDKQKNEYQYITERWMYDPAYSISDSTDWLNKNHFDYRGLIEKGLAIDATGTDIYDVPEELL